MENKIENKNQKDNKSNKPNIKSTTNKAIKKKKPSWFLWPIKILVITIFLSLAFSSLSELILSGAGIAISILIIIFLLIFGILSDMIGVATAACPIEPFTAMCSRKVRGSQIAMSLIKNAEKVSSICNDVIGDICGILSGAAGSVIAAKLILSSAAIDSVQILVAASVSAVIAGLMIFGKALCKKYALDNSTKVVLTTSKILSFFSIKKK